MESKTDIIWLERVDSTNDEARRHISEIDNLSVVSALEQTKGRGQRGNTWLSLAGENLTFSLIVKDFRIKSNEQSAISQATALSLTKLLGRYGIEARIKWPNDIYTGDNKICGILIENSLKGMEIDWSIIGIGLNVNQTSFPEHLPNPTSMRLCTGNSNPYNTRTILEEYIEIFTGYYREYLNGNGSLDKLEQEFVSQMRTNLSLPQ